MLARRSAIVVGAMAFLTLGVSGCGCKSAPDRHPVSVSLGSGFTGRPAIEVHIVALNAQESPSWEEYSMSKYWLPGNTMREGAEKFVMNFGSGNPPTQYFSPKSTPEEWARLWKKWERERATKLFVLAFLPGDPSEPFADKSGALDARRQVVPLDRCKWERRQQQVNFQLTPAKIVVTTPPKTKAG